MRTAPFILGLAACLAVVPVSGAKDHRIPANKNTDVTHLPAFPERVNRGGGDAVGSGGYMQSEPNDIHFMTCADSRARNFGKMRQRLDGFPPNIDGCWYGCDAADAINAGRVDQDYFACLFTCQDPTALNYGDGPYEYRIKCIYPPLP